MKDKTIDYVLRTTWLAVKKMYNEEATNYDSTMATGFTLLSIDPGERHTFNLVRSKNGDWC